MYKKVFVNNGELNLEGVGTRACVDDLIFDLCLGNSEINGVLDLSDGIYSFFNNLEDEKSINCVGVLCEYIKISNTIIKEDIIEDKVEKVNFHLTRKIVNNILVAGIVG